VSGLDEPVYVTAPAGDSRLFVVLKGGLVRILRAGRPAAQPFLDLSGQVSTGGEQGLLSIAFSPAYRTDGRVYVDYTDRTGDTRVVEYRVAAGDPDRVDPDSARQVLHVAQPYSNHNGGLLLFDAEGMLLVGLGDGGSHGDPDNRAQDLCDLLGKVLRIDPRHGSPYAIPADNPFVHRAGARPEVWLSGLRNPWRFSFDPAGALWIGDVGQDRVEEVDAVPAGQQAGRDFGWRVREGDRSYSPGRLERARLVEPVAVYDHTGGRCSVTGGVVAAGLYYFGDYCSGEVWTLRDDPHSPGRSARAGFSVPGLVSFGTDGAGDAYAVSVSGVIWRLVTG
jgi:glucose/arabinose dehydrogenase